MSSVILVSTKYKSVACICSAQGTLVRRSYSGLYFELQTNDTKFITNSKLPYMYVALPDDEWLTIPRQCFF